LLPNDAMSVAHIEVLRTMQDYVGENLNFLGAVEKAWQPSDMLPDFSAADWTDQVHRLRQAMAGLTDEMLVILVGDMITEEALPSYAIALNLIAEDAEGTAQRPWARWMRGWTAEENRHGDLLNAYLRISGRVDMHAVETTIHHLLANGFNPKACPDPYNGLVYTSFQERATKISHGNVGKIAGKMGDEQLAGICAKIAGDEARHEAFYTKMMGRVMELDPAGGILSFRTMMRGLIAMPGKLMFDGRDPDLFDHFAVVAQRSGVYTVHDYAAIIGHLVETWKIAALSVTGRAAQSQEYLCQQAERYASFADEMTATLDRQIPIAFSWIHDRKV